MTHDAFYRTDEAPHIFYRTLVASPFHAMGSTWLVLLAALILVAAVAGLWVRARRARS